MGSKTAIVTGGGQGIGKCIAQELLISDYNVILAEIDSEAGLETEQELSKTGNVKFIHTDTSDEKSVRDLIDKTLILGGRIDTLVNNAAIMLFKPLEELSVEEWNRVISINLTGYFLCARHCSPYLRKSKGSIVNISSTRALMSEPGTESYSASKGGVTSLTHALALSLAGDVRVNSISPGWIEVEDWKKSRIRKTPVHSEEDKKQHPTGRVGTPMDVASMVLFLIDEKNGFITGQNFIVDGGMSTKMIYV